MNHHIRFPASSRLVVSAVASSLLSLAAAVPVAQAAQSSTQTVSEAPLLLAGTVGSERRQDNREDRRDDRGDRQDNRQEARDEGGLVGKDKRDAKQEGRQEARDEANKD